jgi:transcriptional regulator with XRE-family HTH domain
MDEILLSDWLRSRLQGPGAIARLSKDTGLVPSVIYRILSGGSNPDPKTINLIAKSLGVPALKVEKVLVVRSVVVEETAQSLISAAQALLARAAKKLEEEGRVRVVAKGAERGDAGSQARKKGTRGKT